MTWLIHSMAGGDAFFICAVLILLALPVVVLSKRWWLGLPALLVSGLGALIIGLSSIALPLWGFWLWMMLLLGAVVLPITPLGRRWKVGALLAAEAAGLVVIGSELPRQFWRGMPAIDTSRVYVIGDSLSAGVGTENGQTWPLILGRRQPIEVIDLSVAGATTSTILDRIDGTVFQSGLVILEIGGNDVFSRKDLSRFEQDLTRLVRRVSGPGRALVMFELPLYPLNGEYGRVQRRVAQLHGIRLIPRRVLARIITTPGNTIEDGLHLSVPGQRFMAEVVWGLLGPSLSTGPPTDRPTSERSPAH